MNKTDLLPCLPLRDIVVFPGMLVPLFVGREKSIKALKEVMKTNKKIILVTQKNPEIDDPEEENLYSLGHIYFHTPSLQHTFLNIYHNHWAHH